MPTAEEKESRLILDELRLLGRESYRKVLRNHGVAEPVYGVKIEELKKILQRVKGNHALAMALYETGVYDAMYLAGLLADSSKMSKADLRRWLKKADSPPLCDYTVAWVAAESRFGWELGVEWIESTKESVAATGWNVLAGVVALRPDAELDLPAVAKLLQRIETTIHQERNRVRYAMNSFLIAAGCYVQSLSNLAVATAKRIGIVTVDMGATACKVPDAAAFVDKAKQRSAIGKKRKTLRC